MAAFDFTPLYRSTVGFDRVFNAIDRALRLEDTGPSYPPYDIAKTGEDSYRIALAVAGFSQEDLDITLEPNLLTVTGKGRRQTDDGARYLHHGIAGRPFLRRFQLADHVEVDGASLRNGVLEITLTRRVPDALKPQRIEITSGDAKPALPPGGGEAAA